VIHMRLVVPHDVSRQTLELLCESDSVSSVVRLENAAHKPAGDLILAEVAREDASVIVDDLKELGIDERGSISLEEVDTAISKAAEDAEEHAPGLASDAVIWEQVEQRTSENTELGYAFVAFMVIAMMIAAVGVMTDSPILIIGAMVVGPEFGPLAGLCVAIVERRGDLIRRSLLALAVGFPVGILATYLFTLVAKWTGAAPATVAETSRPLTDFISNPDAFSIVVAWLAGTAGILSLTSAKSGALVGVLISVTTIPSAANVGVAAAYTDWSECGGAAIQLGVNLSAIVASGVIALWVQRRLYVARRRKHLRDPVRSSGGLPVGHSRRARAGKT
jgi:uncharacterized hydrophobic protein (TIGR00271 family)